MKFRPAVRFAIRHGLRFGPALALVIVTLAAVLAVTRFSGDAFAQMRGGGSLAMGPAEVGVITLEAQDVPYSVTLPGRAVAWQTADIRPRVSGVVAEILYDAGRRIKAGDPMFRIEDDTYRAALLSAEAAMRQAEAAVATAESSLGRTRSLAGVGATQAAVEAAELALVQAEAGLSAAQAQHQIARLDLDRTIMRSPIDGMADLPEISIGAIVTANQPDPLTTVRRIDPIYVDVAESSAAILRTRDRIRASELQPGDGLGVRLTLEDGQIHEGEGRMVSRGNAVSMTTGTATFRFAFDNPERLILPGQFLRVEVTLGTTRAVLVPQRATSRAADGRLTVFLLRGGRAEQVILTEVGVAENAWVVTEGAGPGDQVIVDGLQNLRDGDEVRGVPVAISGDGVVSDLPVDADAPAAPTDPTGGDADQPDPSPAAGTTGPDPVRDGRALGGDRATSVTADGAGRAGMARPVAVPGMVKPPERAGTMQAGASGLGQDGAPALSAGVTGPAPGSAPDAQPAPGSGGASLRAPAGG